MDFVCSIFIIKYLLFVLNKIIRFKGKKYLVYIKNRYYGVFYLIGVSNCFVIYNYRCLWYWDKIKKNWLFDICILIELI